MKVKIRKPVALGGKLHHKVGAVVEVSDKHGKLLVEDGWAEKVSDTTPVTAGATVEASRIPVNPKQEKNQANEAAAKKAALKEQYAGASKDDLKRIQTETAAVLNAEPGRLDARAVNEVVTELLAEAT
jgi:hypothetical protein